MRRSGRTTRIVDEAIQTLFEKGEVEIKDHYDSTQMHMYVAQRVSDRLRNEHGGLHHSITHPSFQKGIKYPIIKLLIK